MSSLSIQSAITLEWALGSVAIVMTVGRYLVRWYALGVVYWDDIFHGLAVLFAIVDFGIFTGSANVSPHERVKYLNLEVTTTVMWLSCLWCIKFAFLFFYRKIFASSPSFNRYWWGVVAFTFLSYWVAVGGFLSVCNGHPTGVGDPSRCGSPRTLMLSSAWYIYSYCMNVASDLAVLILPMPYISNLYVSSARKLGIASIVCLTLFITAIETARFVENYTLTNGGLVQVWSDVEANVAIIISCLPSYVVFSSLRRRHRSNHASDATLREDSKEPQKLGSDDF